MRKTRLFPVIGLLLILFSIVGITSGCSSNNENISDDDTNNSSLTNDNTAIDNNSNNSTDIEISE